MLRYKKGKIHHQHMYYTILFNNVCIEQKMHACCLEDQKLSFAEQCKLKPKALPDKSKHLMHYDQENCIYCTITKDLKNSSDATATRDFIVYDYAEQEMLQGVNETIYTAKKVTFTSTGYVDESWKKCEISSYFHNIENMRFPTHLLVQCGIG